jgi:hypothetical protein
MGKYPPPKAPGELEQDNSFLKLKFAQKSIDRRAKSW